MKSKSGVRPQILNLQVAVPQPRSWTRWHRCTLLQTFKVKCQRSRSQRENVVWLPNYCCMLETRSRWI